MPDNGTATPDIVGPRYAEIAELAEVNVREANKLLEEGWTLLGIYNRAQGRQAPEAAGGAFYVGKAPVYVLGRTPS